MIIDVVVPDLGESITEVEIGEWLVTVGDAFRRDDPLVAIESDKATVELPAPEAGILVEIVKQQGEVVSIGGVIGRIDTTQSGTDGEEKSSASKSQSAAAPVEAEKKVMPSAAGVLARNNLSAEQVSGSGPGGRILKEDAVREAAKQSARPASPGQPGASSPPADEDGVVQGEHRVPMTLLRRTIAGRLLEATQGMALLTTFNEVDLSAVKELRATLGTEFSEKYGVRLGFMSFFVKAAIAGLGDFPVVNARLDGNDIVYHDYCDIGVAIGGGKGLVVPVIRRAEQLNFAEIELKIADFGQRAKDNALSPEELSGGTFTISNGGVYGSMLSTPIVNPPQSAILGLHAIKDRPVVVNGKITIRPIMYLALSYDHRIIDGREAVGFLKGLKERIELPQKLLLEI